ncbi:MAG: VOC family protein [Rickettsiales bacterium]
MKPRISMITLGVKNLEKSIEFYQKGLNLPRMNSQSEIAFFALNGTWLALYSMELLAKDANVNESLPDGKGFKGFTLSHNLKSKEEVNKTYEEAIKAGGIKVKKPQKVFWVATQVTSKIQMAICGRSPTIHTFGWDQKNSIMII